MWVAVAAEEGGKLGTQRPVRRGYKVRRATRGCANVTLVSVTGIGPDLAGKAAGGRKLIAVVYADMVGYSRLIGLDDAGTAHPAAGAHRSRDP